MKYQFSIHIIKSGDKNSAATKAVVDCKALFAQRGYHDYTLQVHENTGKVNYFLSIIKALISFYFTIEKGSLIGIQYPMLNTIFKYFIRAARFKKVKFFCIIHDIESLRLGGLDDEMVKAETTNLNFYDCLIVHNIAMAGWLQSKGVTTRVVPLELFDYLTDGTAIKKQSAAFSNTVVFAGNLSKSNFIYSLSKIPNWRFNVYGPNFKKGNSRQSNVNWRGEYSPDEIVEALAGDFGLIWDGERIEDCDEVLGNYLRYNNPHKLSLYFAAGLPVIAPAHSAIAELIHSSNAGILIHSLADLKKIQLTSEEYLTLKENCLKMNAKITSGGYFLAALDKVEEMLLHA